MPTTMVNVETPPVLIADGVNDFEMVGGASTVPLAAALLVVNVAGKVCPL